MSEIESSDRRRWSDMSEELAGLGYWRLDLATRQSQWSPNMYRIYGFEPGGEGPGDAGLERIHPEDRPEADAKLAAALTGTAGVTLTRVVWPDGTVRHTEGRIGCEFDAQGAVIAIYGAVMDITERRNADAERAVQAAHLALLADHGADLIVEVDCAQTIRYVSGSIRRYGYAPDDLIGRTTRDLVHPEDVGRVHAIVEDLLSGKTLAPDWDRTYRLVASDGTLVWIEGNPTIIRDPAGRPTGVITVLRDIDDHRVAEQALARSEARYRLIADNATDIIACYDRLGRFSFLSSAIEAVMGYTPAEMVGQAPMAFMHPDDIGPVTQVFRDFARRAAAGPGAESIRFEYRAFRKDGGTIWLEAHPKAVYDTAGQLVEFQDVVREVTERKRIEADLAESEQRYRVLAENVTDIVSCTGLDGQFKYFSPSVLGVTGYTAAELMGTSLLETMHPEDVPRATAYFEAAVSGERAEGQSLTYRTRHRSGEWIWLECNPTVVRNAAGEPIEFIDVTRDVTARERLEAELRTARDAAEAAAAVKSDFMANMSHEIRTPLTAVIGFSSLISARTDLDPTAREHADRISSAGRALLALVNDVLDFSKLEAGRMELAPRPVDPATVAREALDLFSLQAEAKGLHLVFDPGPALPACVALDPKAIGQVLLNLLGNAVKFSEAGQVALSLAYEANSETLRVAVRDSGPGLSTEQARRLFQRFSQVDASSTRRHGGTGLGLAICKGLVEAMGGEIGVDSVVGEGSTFHFSICAPLAIPAKVSIEGVEDTRDLDGVRLLVVDDNPINRELVRALLTPLGIEVTEAVDGPSGLDAATALPFDIVLLDIRMPGLDGPSVLARLRAAPGPNQDTPVLAFSAEFEGGGAAGFDDFVSKPLDPRSLISAIARWTALHTEEDVDVRKG